MSERMQIEYRHRIAVPTDRYGYCHRLEWSGWEPLEGVDSEAAERRLEFWRELNDYAVSQRGEGAKKEFRLVACALPREV